jgi:probable F420-dependent oxidoreductase
MVLAKSLATLDQMSGGRLVVGIGVGGLEEENRALGVPYENRGAFADEAIEVMMALWGSTEAEFEGSYYAFRDLKSAPRPRQDPLPLWVGGSGGPARRRAARYGRGWHPMCSAQGLARRLPKLEEELAEQGRSRDDIVVAPRVDIGQVPDRAGVDAYRNAGADQLIVATRSGDIDEIRAGLAHVAFLAGQV